MGLAPATVQGTVPAIIQDPVQDLAPVPGTIMAAPVPRTIMVDPDRAPIPGWLWAPRAWAAS